MMIDDDDDDGSNIDGDEWVIIHNTYSDDRLIARLCIKVTLIS